MATRTLLTFEQFERYEDDDMNHELIQGEHVVTPPTAMGRSLVRQNLHDALPPARAFPEQFEKANGLHLDWMVNSFCQSPTVKTCAEAVGCSPVS